MGGSAVSARATIYCAPMNFSSSLDKEAAPKSSVTGGSTLFQNKKGLVRRMTVNQSALDTCDIGEHFTYPQRDEKMRQKFFRAV